MLELNFLPQKEQSLVRRNLAWLVLRNVMVWFSVITIIIVMMFLWSRVVLETNLADVQERGVLVSSSKLSFVSQIEQINAQVDEVDKIQKEYVIWSQVLFDIARLIPQGSHLSELSINSNEQVFSLSGFSNTRDDLLLLENNLSNAEFIAELNSPVSNLLKSTDIQFRFSGKVHLLDEEPEPEPEPAYRD